MKIAFISFEYPPDTAYGGIATYVQQAAKMLAKRGHFVEVFAGSRERTCTDQEGEIRINRIKVGQKVDFIHTVVPVFLKRHQAIQFDVLEGPEYGADASAVIQAVPELPLVVKLHTPRTIIEAYEGKPRLLDQLRSRLGALRRGIHPLRDLEKTHTLDADEVAAPSQALGKELIQRWRLDSSKVNYYPLPFNPNPRLLEIQPKTFGHRVTFVGRLDIKKGVVDLADAIPTVLESVPEAKFRLIGRNGQSPQPNVDMQQFLMQKLAPYLAAVEFTGQVPAEKIPDYLADTDICVFPSQWESFGLVCLEAMTAGRSVIGSSAGGMAEIITSDQVGRLVPPQSPEKIAAAVIELLKDPDLCSSIGHNARQKVLDEYSPQRIAELQENSYIRAIQQRKSQAKRKVRVLL